jgi:hypothetical protein
MPLAQEHPLFSTFSLLRAYRDDFPGKREYTPNGVGKSAGQPMQAERRVM